MREAKLTATQKFHPDNQRLRRPRMKKMADEELDLWIAHGIMVVAATQGANDVGVGLWRGERHLKIIVSLHYWAKQKLETLEEIKRLRARRCTLVIP